MARNSTKIKHARIDPADKLAKALDIAEGQLGHARFKVVGVPSGVDAT